MLEKIVAIVKDMREKQNTTLDNLEITYANLLDKFKKDKDSNISELKAIVENATQAKLKELTDRFSSKLDDIENTQDKYERMITENVLAKMPEPIEPDIPADKLRDKLEGLKDENRLGIEAIKGCEEEHKKLMDKIEETKKSMLGTRMGRFFGGTPHNLLQTIDVSSQIDGTNREFTSLPVARFYPFAFSSQSPFILLPNTHYTIGRNSITIGNNLEPLQSGAGQYLFVAFIK